MFLKRAHRTRVRVQECCLVLIAIEHPHVTAVHFAFLCLYQIANPVRLQYSTFTCVRRRFKNTKKCADVGLCCKVCCVIADSLSNEQRISAAVRHTNTLVLDNRLSMIQESRLVCADVALFIYRTKLSSIESVRPLRSVTRYWLLDEPLKSGESSRNNSLPVLRGAALTRCSLRNVDCQLLNV